MPQPQEIRKPIVRKDPVGRRVHGTSPVYTKLKNPDPRRYYVNVNTGDPDAMAEYKVMGYTPEVKTPDGVDYAAGGCSRPGEPLQQRGSMLMSIDRAEHEKILRYGPDGQSGLELADQFEERLATNRAMFDPVRGMHGIMGRSGRQVLATESMKDNEPGG